MAVAGRIRACRRCGSVCVVVESVCNGESARELQPACNHNEGRFAHAGDKGAAKVQEEGAPGEAR